VAWCVILQNRVAWMAHWKLLCNFLAYLVCLSVWEWVHLPTSGRGVLRFFVWHLLQCKIPIWIGIYIITQIGWIVLYGYDERRRP